MPRKSPVPPSASGEIAITFADTPARVRSFWRGPKAYALNVTVSEKCQEEVIAKARNELKDRKTLTLKMDKIKNTLRVSEMTINGVQVWPTH